jgi:hypothetical protein
VSELKREEAEGRERKRIPRLLLKEAMAKVLPGRTLMA